VKHELISLKINTILQSKLKIRKKEIPQLRVEETHLRNKALSFKFLTFNFSASVLYIFFICLFCSQYIYARSVLWITTYFRYYKALISKFALFTS